MANYPASPSRVPGAALVALLLLLPAACGREPPPPGVEAAMVSLYCDLALAAGATGEAAPDSVRDRIFADHGTDQAAYEDALSTYAEDPRGWVGFFRAVVDTLEARSRP